MALLIKDNNPNTKIFLKALEFLRSNENDSEEQLLQMFLQYSGIQLKQQSNEGKKFLFFSKIEFIFIQTKKIESSNTNSETNTETGSLKRKASDQLTSENPSKKPKDTKE